MTIKQKLESLKSINLKQLTASLAIVSSYKRGRENKYIIKYATIDIALSNKLKSILKKKIEAANTISQYNFDSSVPDDTEITTIQSEETDFQGILEKLGELNPEDNLVSGVEDLNKANSYVIILSNDEGIELVGFSKLPENWSIKKLSNILNVMMNNNNEFTLIENNPVFRISNNIDFIYYANNLFILEQRKFEQALNFRSGMIQNAEKTYDSMKQISLLSNLELLKSKVGDNLAYLRKVATIERLGHYKNPIFISKLENVLITKREWNINMHNGQIEINDDNLDSVLQILQNKRLRSDITEEDFDVPSAQIVLSI